MVGGVSAQAGSTATSNPCTGSVFNSDWRVSKDGSRLPAIPQRDSVTRKQKRSEDPNTMDFGGDESVPEHPLPRAPKDGSKNE